jgi:flavin-dependent dehydrogenase
MTSPYRSHHDVVVVGGRCAGAPTAMLLARHGHDVVVLERATFPSDVTSTHAIARGGVVQLARWGALDPVLSTGAPAVREVTFGSGPDATTRAVKDSAGVDLLLAPRRYVLDTLMAELATEAGAAVRTGITATGVLRSADGRVSGVTARTAWGERLELSARFVVGADGVRSRAARWVGAPVQEGFAADVGTFYAYVGGVPWRGFEYHVAQDAFAGVFPTHDGEACVWLGGPAGALRGLRGAGTDRTNAFVDALTSVAPDLGDHVRDGRVTSPVRGAVNLPNHVRTPVGPGWALVGDAGYHRDPLTGHGITDAYRDAELLATALDASLRDPRSEQEAMATYHRRRDAALREVFDITRSMTAFPPPERFVEAQKQLSGALESEAQLLASLPEPPGSAAATAAA